MDEYITVEQAERALLHGACAVPRVGTRVARLTTEQLIWAEERGFTLQNLLPIWVLSSGSGYGYGDGYGDGSRYGYGDE